MDGKVFPKGLDVLALGGIFCFFGVGPLSVCLGLVFLGLSTLAQLEDDALTAAADWSSDCQAAGKIASVISTSSGNVEDGGAELVSFDSARTAN